MLCFPLINVKMPTIVGIVTFMRRKTFMLSYNLEASSHTNVNQETEGNEIITIISCQLSPIRKRKGESTVPSPLLCSLFISQAQIPKSIITRKFTASCSCNLDGVLSSETMRVGVGKFYFKYFGLDKRRKYLLYC